MPGELLQIVASSPHTPATPDVLTTLERRYQVFTALGP